MRRLAEAHARFVLLIAPAGFGKTTLARQFAERFPAGATCDCTGIASEQELCRRIIAALGRELPGTRQPLTELQFAIGAGSEADADLLLQLWSAHGPASAFTFENAEALASQPQVRALLGRLLAATPPRRAVTVCSRTPVRIPTSRTVLPHETLTLRAADFAFDRSEIEEAFAEFGLPSATLDQIEAVTRGWPIALLVLRRFTQEGRLSDLLTRLDDVAFDDVHDYLAGEVFGSLSERELDTLIACAAIADATDEDLAAALDVEVAEAAEAVEGLLRASPLLARTPQGTYEVHPLLEHTIRTRYRRRRSELLAAAANAWLALGRLVRAAALFQRLGDRDATARALCEENVASDRVPTEEYTQVVTSLDDETMRRYPVLRSFTTFFRRFRTDPFQLCNDARDVWEAIAPGADFELRCNIGCPLARLLYETGHFDEAAAVLAELVAHPETLDEGPLTSGQAYVVRTLACIAVRQGHFAEGRRLLERGYQTVPGRLVLTRYAIERGVIARVHGRRTEEREHLRQAIECGRKSSMRVLGACALAEAAFGAWLAGEDSEAVALADQLEAYITVNAMRGLAHFCASARPHAIPAPLNGCEQPNWLACAFLLICVQASSSRDRVAAARSALEAANRSADPFLRTLAAVALGLCDAGERERCLAEAARLAAGIESPELQNAIGALVTGDSELGILAPLVARLRHTGEGRARETLAVDFLSQNVRRNGEPVRLGERELALVLALARQRRTYSRRELIEIIWPDVDETKAREALNSCLYRLRARLGEDAVGWTGTGYRLRDDAEVDLRSIEALVASSPAERALRPAERIIFERLLQQIRNRHIAAGDRADWLVSVETRIDDLGARIAERLGRDALRRSDLATTLELGRAMAEYDSCDEVARELTIRALLAQGDRGSAMREFRAYQRVLRAELDVEPSEHLARLLDDGGVPPAHVTNGKAALAGR